MAASDINEIKSANCIISSLTRSNDDNPRVCHTRTRWNVIIALTSWPAACFFFGLVRLGRCVDGLHIQLPPWLGTRFRIHNQNLWQDVPPRLGGGGGGRRRCKRGLKKWMCVKCGYTKFRHFLLELKHVISPMLTLKRSDSGDGAPVSSQQWRWWWWWWWERRGLRAVNTRQAPFTPWERRNVEEIAFKIRRMSCLNTRSLITSEIREGLSYPTVLSSISWAFPVGWYFFSCSSESLIGIPHLFVGVDFQAFKTI